MSTRCRCKLYKDIFLVLQCGHCICADCDADLTKTACQACGIIRSTAALGRVPRDLLRGCASLQDLERRVKAEIKTSSSAYKTYCEAVVCRSVVKHFHTFLANKYKPGGRCYRAAMMRFEKRAAKQSKNV